VPKHDRSADEAEAALRDEGGFPGARESAVNLRRLRYFARIVEAGNITRAAEQLFVAQPALGLQIRQLEQALGVSLLVRHSRGVSPTRAGQLLYERACEVLRLVDDTERVVTAAGRHERENIVLGLTNGVMSMVGRDIVMAAGKELPSIQLNLVEEMSGALMDSLEREELDIAIAYDAHERPGLLRVPLLVEEPLFVCAGEGAVSGPIEFAELAARPLVVPGTRDVVRRQLDAAARRLALSLNVAMEVSSIAARKSLVEHGDAVTIMAYGSVAAEVERGRLATRRIVNPTLHRTLYLVRSLRRAEFKHERELIDFIGRIVLVFSERLGELAKRLAALDRPLSQVVAELDSAGMGDGEPLP
jgi:LysR family nitrogen assimilation transcriptional regulator